MSWKELSSQSKDFPKMWDWETDGEKVEGELVKVDTGVGKNESNVYTIKAEEGEVGIWGTAVLDNRLNELELGTKVQIIYKGERKNPESGRTFKDFSIAVWSEE